jgi:hypothetical protein
MKKTVTIIAGIAGAAVAAGIGMAAPAQAGPCSYFNGGTPDKSICGVPNINDSIANARKNLQNNFNPQTALNNLQHAITHGVGTAG